MAWSGGKSEFADVLRMVESRLRICQSVVAGSVAKQAKALTRLQLYRYLIV